MKSIWYLLLAIAGAYLAAFLIFPVVHVLESGFFQRMPDGSTRWTLDFYQSLGANASVHAAFVNSLAVAFAATLLSALIALPLALATHVYKFRGKAWVGVLLLVPLILPPFVGAIAVKRLLARFGTLNILLMKAGIISEPIDFTGSMGFWGVVGLQALHLYPILVLNVQAALANCDPTLEEAAENLGAPWWSRLWRVTLPLILPGIFAGAIIVFIWAFTDLGTPLVFEYRAVVPVRIFDSIQNIDENRSGYALITLMLLMTAVLFYASKQLFSGGSFETVRRGDTAGIERAPGRLASVVLYGFILLVIGASVLPHTFVAVNAFADRWFMTALPESYTTQYFSLMFQNPMSGPSIRNSIVYSTASCAVDVLLGTAIAVLLARSTVRGRSLLDTLSMLPLALPGIILAFGYMAAFARPADDVLAGKSLGDGLALLNPANGLGAMWTNAGKILRSLAGLLDPRVNPTWLLIIGYSVRRLPFIVRAVYAGLAQLPRSYEEASYNLGASWLRTLGRVVVPLVGVNILAGAILAFSFAMLEVSDSLVLARKESFYPLTKAIYDLQSEIPEGPYVACGLGVLGMGLLVFAYFAAGRLLGGKMGTLFRA